MTPQLPIPRIATYNGQERTPDGCARAGAAYTARALQDLQGLIADLLPRPAAPIPAGTIPLVLLALFALWAPCWAPGSGASAKHLADGPFTGHEQR